MASKVSATFLKKLVDSDAAQDITGIHSTNDLGESYDLLAYSMSDVTITGLLLVGTNTKKLYVIPQKGDTLDMFKAHM